MNKKVPPVAIIIGLIALFHIVYHINFSRHNDVHNAQMESPVENKSYAQVSTPNEFKKEVKSDDKESISDAMSEVDVNLSSKTTPAQHSTAQHSTAQHSTAQHSTAQHSTAQHSTAQHSTCRSGSCYVRRSGEVECRGTVFC